MKSWVCAVVGTGAVLLTARVAEAADCKLEQHEGYADDAVVGIEETVCGLLRDHAGSYRVRVTRVGSKTLFTLVPPNGHEARLVLANLDEVTIAAPRLVEAADAEMSISETADVSNVVEGDETRTPKSKPSRAHGWVGFIGGGLSDGQMGGGNAGLSFGSERWAFATELRLAGSNSTAYVSVTGGIRHHFSASDFSPFLGTGIGFDVITRRLQPDLELQSSNAYVTSKPEVSSGAIGYAELGIEILRTHQLGGTFTLRGDIPAFAIDESKIEVTNGSVQRLHRSVYSPVLTAGFALRF